MAFTPPPTFATGALLSASALNTISKNVEFLKGRIDGTQALSCGDIMDSSDTVDSRYWLMYKHAGMDYLYHSFLVTAGSGHTVELFISSDMSTWGTDYWSYASVSTIQYTGHTSISALTDDTWYMMRVDVSYSGSGNIQFHRFELKSTNT